MDRLDIVDVVLRTKSLFKGHEFLISGLNTFLPKGYEILFPFNEDPIKKYKPVDIDQARKYVKKIKVIYVINI